MASRHGTRSFRINGDKTNTQMVNNVLKCKYEPAASVHVHKDGEEEWGVPYVEFCCVCVFLPAYTWVVI